MPSLNVSSIFLLVGLLGVPGCGGGGGDGDSECLNVKKLRDPLVSGAKVTADFAVTTCAGDPVPGLLFPGNFEVFEDGSSVSGVTNKPKIDSNPQNFKVYTLMLVDVNAGIRSVDPDLANVRGAVKAFAQSVLGSGANRLVAVYAFDGQANIQKLSDFTSNVDELNSTIETKLACTNTAICVDPSSNLNGAIVMGLSTLAAARTAGANGGLTAGTMAVFTDGVDRAGRVSQSTAISAIKSSSNDSAVFTIAMSSDQQNLTTLKEYGKDGFVSSADIGMLMQAFATIADRVNGFANSNYRLQYCTGKRTGNHNLEVKVTYTDALKKKYLGFLEGSFKAADSSECTIQ